MTLYQRIGLLLYNLMIGFFEFVFFFTHYWWWKLMVLRAYYYFGESSYRIFKREQDRTGDLDERNFTYGETGVLAAKLILQEINPPKGALLYDLGSGRGTFLFAANFLFDLRGVGIELLTPYIVYGKKLKKALKVGGIQFINDNILNVDLSPADIVYIAGTTYEDRVLEGINKNLTGLRSGAIVISVHHPIPGEEFILFYEGKFPFSWGTDQVFFYRRKEV
jgi:hypothetical protein